MHLQPVRWAEDWPLMGEPIAGSSTTGQPVMSHVMPDVGRSWPVVNIQTLDKFDGEKLGVQWEWNHNPVDANWSLATNPGFMRLQPLPATDFLAARNTLTQVLHGPTAVITARMEVAGMRDGQRAGLGMLQVQPSWIGVVQTAGVKRLTWSSAGAQISGPVVEGLCLEMRLNVSNETGSYEFSLDGGKTFTRLGEPAKLRFSWWKGARPALFSYTTSGDAGGFVDFDWFYVAP